MLEVASARLYDGTILQVGKTNEIRLALLRRFELIVGIVSILALTIGITGGLVLTRSTVQPIYELIDVVQKIITTGRTDMRVPVREPVLPSRSTPGTHRSFEHEKARGARF